VDQEDLCIAVHKKSSKDKTIISFSFLPQHSQSHHFALPNAHTRFRHLQEWDANPWCRTIASRYIGILVCRAIFASFIQGETRKSQLHWRTFTLCYLRFVHTFSSPFNKDILLWMRIWQAMTFIILLSPVDVDAHDYFYPILSGRPFAYR
jgi:hypothetical protein